MPVLPEDLFANPVLTALETTHAHLALTAGEASRYQSEVSPFAALRSPSIAALGDLHSLVCPGERIWLPAISGVDPSAAGFIITQELPCHQMLLPESIRLPDANPAKLSPAVVPMSCADAGEMVALTEISFPGFFRPRTCEMGDYFGIRSGETGELIAMAGERLTFPGYSEISGICTHPDYRGRGLAAALTFQVARHQREQGIVSWLHVSAANHRAISLYLGLGFEIARTVPLTQLARLMTR